MASCSHDLLTLQVNIELPLPAPSTFSPRDLKLLAPFWFRQLASKHNTVVPVFVYVLLLVTFYLGSSSLPNPD